MNSENNEDAIVQNLKDAGCSQNMIMAFILFVIVFIVITPFILYYDFSLFFAFYRLNNQDNQSVFVFYEVHLTMKTVFLICDILSGMMIN